MREIFPIFFLLFLGFVGAVKIIDNGLAPPEIVHTPVSTKPRCKVFAPPLDLVFILDSSGSLKDKFQDEINIIRRIIKHVTIGKTATRVMLIQFSGTQHLEFNFEKFQDREELLAALDVLRHVSGITRIGGAFEFTLARMKDHNSGLRDQTVPKIVYVLSDGRTHDYPKDWQMSDILRRLDEINIIRRIIKHVTIGKTATRVMLIQFSGTQHLEFNFEKFQDREELLAALDVLRHVSGITRIGGAFEFTLARMKDHNSGLRDQTVPKIVYVLSDGRTHDYPKDWQMSDILRREIPNVDIWAYGTGDYVAMTALANYTRSEQKIVTNQNLQKLEPQFDKFRGTEICEEQPACIKGSDKPLDLALVVDASESLDHLFTDQIKFLLDRVLPNINIHPEAVRLALISYSGSSFVHFKFNSFRYGNNTAVAEFVRNMRSIKGTTATNIALEDAFDLLTSNDAAIGIRDGVPKMALVLTDGHSHRSPKQIAEKMRASGIIMIAVSVTPRPLVDEAELLLIAGEPKRAFSPPNLQDFEKEFMKYVGFGCDGIELPPDAKPQIRGATEVRCTENSMSIIVRTQRALQGLMYAHNYHDVAECQMRKTDDSREIQMTFNEGTCGLIKTPTADGHGYHLNITVILQFHPLIITRADQGLDMSCFVASRVPRGELTQAVLRNAAETQCVYRLHRYSPGQCVALDAKVGETLYHRWECDCPEDYNYLVHDCFVQSEKHTQQIIDSNGCEVDQHFLETPNYSRFKDHPDNSYVFQEMSVFKFPGDGNLLFHCKISLCNMKDPNAACNQSIPPKCTKKPSTIPVRNKRAATSREEVDNNDSQWISRQIQKRHLELKNRARRQIVETKAGYYMTLHVETRTLNVLLSESIRRRDSVKYCDIS